MNLGARRTRQSESEQALRDAQNAEHALTAAQGQVRRADAALDDAPADATSAALAPLRGALASARRDRDAAEAALELARADLQAATSLRDDGARRAVDTIRGTTDNDGLRDSWWDNWGSAVFGAISQVAGIVAGVTGILALVLCWVPVLGQALAAVAAIATAVKLVADIVLLANGEGSWGDIGWDAFALATFGAGRVLGAVARSAGTGAQGVARLDAGRLAAQSVASRAAQGLPTGSSAATITDLVGDVAGALSRLQARPLAQQASTSLLQALRRPEVWATLKPQAIWSDVAAVRSLGTSAQGWSSAFGSGATHLASAWPDPRALVGALQADHALTTAASTLPDIAPVLTQVAPTTARALGVANAAYATSGATVGVGAYDQTVGVSATVDWMSGGNSPAAIVSPFVAISETFGFGPSPAEQLGLR
ncbi:hypothetical protein QUV83_06980 [Cellulomonas cellasea]|uniref:hypothetical protein n=1 Tax=Cellulomonas cellasea TaxID=43670 RepID=UPI0025A33EB9|nr:hypothetical protein [Cellulomonas cellasea]MDM8084500.1 hypothetical protein [Cellulomonas cellasea]